jgi:hypothetical protein
VTACGVDPRAIALAAFIGLILIARLARRR